MIMPHQRPHSSSAPPDLHSGLVSFHYRYPQTMAVGFVMMSFRDGDEQAMIRRALVLASEETDAPLLTVDAEDRAYHPDLLQNIRVYMHGCAFGVAFFDSRPANPNVALETGYMIGIGKPILLMKSEPLPALQSDLIGRLYVPYDPTATSSALAKQIASWVRANILVRADDSAPIAHGSVRILL